jgi:4-aminobutyrate aminotransferase
MDHGAGCVVWDVDGNAYLDFTAGIAVCATGHSHPDVVAAITEQVGKFLHMSGTDFYYPQQVELAERLAEVTPGDEPKRVFFTNSGTESVEGAIKLARYATGRPRIVAFTGAFHGRTLGSLSLTASKVIHRRSFGPLLPGVSHVPYGYCYRCPYNLTYPECDIACVEEIERTLFSREVPPDEVAAIFLEPIQGEGGYIVPPDGWLQRLRGLCDRHGILLVVDEVQSGMGRTGKWFAVDHWSVVPDIICLAKGIASGLPLGAIVAPRDLMDWPPGAHASTFGGNPVSCVAALKTIELLANGLIKNAAEQGAYMIRRLRQMADRYSVIGDVRGLGLMLGVELVEDVETRKPAHSLRDRVVEACYQQGLLVLGAGFNVLRFMPPLVVDRPQVDKALEIFEAALAQTTM